MAVNWSDVANLLTVGGVGAAIGGIAQSVVQLWGKRGQVRSDIADTLTNSAGSWVARVDARNVELSDDIKKYRRALSIVDDLVEEAVDLLCNGGVDPKSPGCEKLREIRRLARDAL